MTDQRRDDDDGSDFDSALDALDAGQLRALVRELLLSLDEVDGARLMSEVVDCAARASNGWSPRAPSEHRVEEIESFVDAARRVHMADPSEVDDYLLEGTRAFLARNYPAAVRIFGALLRPIGDGDIHLGQDELVDEVLGVDVHACAMQYLVAVYMTTSPPDRSHAVHAAIEDIYGVSSYFQPLRELEEVAVEPLPDFEDFLVLWRALVEERFAAAPARHRGYREDRWLREVVSRTEGADGLAEIARQSRRPDDLQAWCRELVKARDWTAARAACEEAAELLEGHGGSRGDFLDGAALAARELGSTDFEQTLERAWREAPSLGRLCRVLGGSATRDELAARAGSALEVVPAAAARQRALLHIVRGELDAAAVLLASAPGLGWSSAEHPGSLAFPLFVALLGGGEIAIEPPHSYADWSGLMDNDGPRLETPTVDALLRLADLRAPKDDALRSSMVAAMRRAVEQRALGVTSNKRRGQYRHVASLALQCARADGSPQGRAWLGDLMARFRRYPALQREFKAAGGRG